MAGCSDDPADTGQAHSFIYFLDACICKPNSVLGCSQEGRVESCSRSTICCPYSVRLSYPPRRGGLLGLAWCSTLCPACNAWLPVSGVPPCSLLAQPTAYMDRCPTAGANYGSSTCVKGGVHASVLLHGKEGGTQTTASTLPCFA